MPWYRSFGKIETPITEAEFKEGLDTGHFVQRNHRAYCILLYYTGIRKMEALKLTREQFKLEPNRLMLDVERLKHSKKTPALPIYLNHPFVNELEYAVLVTPKGKRVFPYSQKTGYNIVRRAFKYPHYFRLSLITKFFQQGFTIAEVRSWTGLSLKALDYYVGLVAIDKMGKKA
jgi:integrase